MRKEHGKKVLVSKKGIDWIVGILFHCKEKKGKEEWVVEFFDDGQYLDDWPHVRERWENK